MSRVDESTPWANRCGCCPPKTIAMRNKHLRDGFDELKSKGLTNSLMEIDALLDIEVEHQGKFYVEMFKITDAMLEQRQIERNKKLEEMKGKQL